MVIDFLCKKFLACTKVDMNFNYPPLAADDIRLLHIEPDSHPDEIRLSMKHYKRDQVPSYVAISYTWGRESASHSIILNVQIYGSAYVTSLSRPMELIVVGRNLHQTE